MIDVHRRVLAIGLGGSLICVPVVGVAEEPPYIRPLSDHIATNETSFPLGTCYRRSDDQLALTRESCALPAPHIETRKFKTTGAYYTLWQSVPGGGARAVADARISDRMQVVVWDTISVTSRRSAVLEGEPGLWSACAAITNKRDLYVAMDATAGRSERKALAAKIANGSAIVPWQTPFPKGVAVPTSAGVVDLVVGLVPIASVCAGAAAAEMRRLRSEVDEAKQRADAAERVSESLRSAVDAGAASVTALNTLVVALNHQIDDLHAQVSSEQKHGGALLDQIANLQETVRTLLARLAPAAADGGT